MRTPPTLLMRYVTFYLSRALSIITVRCNVRWLCVSTDRLEQAEHIYDGEPLLQQRVVELSLDNLCPCGETLKRRIGNWRNKSQPEINIQQTTCHVVSDLLCSERRSRPINRYTRSSIHIILSTNNRSFLSVCFPSSLEPTSGFPSSTTH